MKCPHCPCEQPPAESGPYSGVHIGQHVYLVCRECRSIIDCVPIQPQPQVIVMPVIVGVRSHLEAA